MRCISNKIKERDTKIGKNQTFDDFVLLKMKYILNTT